MTSPAPQTHSRSPMAATRLDLNAYLIRRSPMTMTHRTLQQQRAVKTHPAKMQSNMLNSRIPLPVLSIPGKYATLTLMLLVHALRAPNPAPPLAASSTGGRQTLRQARPRAVVWHAGSPCRPRTRGDTGIGRSLRRNAAISGRDQGHGVVWILAVLFGLLRVGLLGAWMWDGLHGGRWARCEARGRCVIQNEGI
jgi:hypothetical protein